MFNRLLLFRKVEVVSFCTLRCNPLRSGGVGKLEKVLWSRGLGLLFEFFFRSSLMGTALQAGRSQVQFQMV